MAEAAHGKPLIGAPWSDVWSSRAAEAVRRGAPGVPMSRRTLTDPRTCWGRYVVLVVVALAIFGLTYATKVPASSRGGTRATPERGAGGSEPEVAEVEAAEVATGVTDIATGVACVTDVSRVAAFSCGVGVPTVAVAAPHAAHHRAHEERGKQT